MPENDGFTPVKRKRRGRGKATGERKSLEERMSQVDGDLEKEEWFSAFTDTLSVFRERCSVKPAQAICLGLGSPSEWAPARYQLALLRQLCQRLEIPPSEVKVYDPVFTDEDKDYLANLGMQVEPVDKEARYELLQPTLLYMPHCDLPFYNNVFEVNWSLDRLGNMLLLGNNLGDYVVSGPTKRVQAKGPLVHKIVPYLAATALPAKFPLEDAAFNDLQLQFVKISDLPPEEDEFWKIENPNPEDASAA